MVFRAKRRLVSIGEYSILPVLTFSKPLCGGYNTDRHMKKYILSQVVLLTAFSLFSQKNVPFLGKIAWVNGFSREISGENLAYFSAYPDYATVSLLTRCTDGQKAIEWETAAVPTQIRGKYVYFSWVAAHSSGTSSGERHFDLYVNDEKRLTFVTQPAHRQPDWTFAAADSTRVVFQQTKRDGANDAHGLMFLRLPADQLEPGRPVRIRVTGQAEHSNDWYMTFKFSFEEKTDIASMPFLLANGDQPLVLTALHFGKPQTIEVRAGSRPPVRFVAREGVNHFDVPLPAALHPDSVRVRITVGSKTLVNRYVHRQPVIHRELHFIHHSHTDIGYSHLQPEVEKIHNRNIDDALAMIAATRHLPEAARFKWNVESLWAAENYLRQASPEQKEAFLTAVRAGDICLSALYANILTGMSQPEELFHYTDFAQKLKKDYGLELPSAMMSDVPGAAWSMVTALAQNGVRYLSSGPNYLGDKHPYLGDRVGHFVKSWGDRPVWWASPSGTEKVLFWAGAKGYSSWHGTAPGGVFDRGTNKIAAYLNELTAGGYPYELVQWRYNIVSDNGPIDTAVSRFVAEWNHKYASPKIVLNTTDRLFAAFEQRYGDSLPVVRGDMTPYWEDGAISTADEEGKTRANSLRLQQLGTLYAMLAPEAYPEAQFDAAWRNILLFHEHTWGAHNSISHPDLPFVTEQWRIKKQFFTDGNAQIDSLSRQLFQPFEQANSRHIAVFNTLSHVRSGVVILSCPVTGPSVRDAQGRLHPLQPLSTGQVAFVANNVPPLGVAIYEMTDQIAPVNSPFVFGPMSVSNGRIEVEWDQKGSIRRLETAKDVNFAGSFNQQGLNSYWYVPGLDPAHAVSNGAVKVQVLEKGPVLARISIRAEDAPGAAYMERILTLTAGSEVLKMDNWVDKKAVRAKEALHFGFPFDTVLNNVTLDAGYCTLRYLTDQLPGSNMDYLYGRRWLDASDADRGIQWMLLETPLAEPSAMIDERLLINGSHKVWKTGGTPASTWFSYAMNNYWHTNYKADQSGLARFRYALRPHGRYNSVETERAASEFTQPLVAIPVRYGAVKGGGVLALTNERVVITSVTPQGDGGFLVRLYNPDAAPQATSLQWLQWQPAFITSDLGDRKMAPDAEITLSGMEVKSVRVYRK